MAVGRGHRPLVSVVTPSYNQGLFIRETIESVLGQDYPNLEYIVIDGGSTDETAAIATEYDQRLTWISEPDRGQTHALNKGFALARGEVLTWLNADDVLLPGAVAAMVDAFASDPEAGLVYGDGYWIDADGRVMTEVHSPEPDYWSLVEGGDHILQPAAFFTRAALERVGELDEGLRWAMDWDLFIRMSRELPVVHSPFMVAAVRVHPRSKTSGGGWRRLAELVGVIRRYSKRKLLPAYIHHAWELLSRAPRRYPTADERPRSRLQRLLRHLDVAMFARTVAWYPDGWARKWVRLRLVPRRGSSGIEIRGTVPQVRGVRQRQRLQVLVDGNVHADAVLSPGAFAFLVPVADNGQPVELVLRASTSFSLARLGRQDRRRVAYRLETVRFVDAGAGEQASQSGWFRDGWMARQLYLRTPVAGDALEIVGSVPRDVPRLRRQQLRVACGAYRAKHRVVGPFRLAVPVDAGNGTVVELRLRAKRSFTPADADNSEDDRRLALHLEAIRWLPSGRPAASRDD